MAQAVRGFPLLPVYSGGFSAICFICHFSAPVRRFNSGRYPPILPLPCVRCTPCLRPFGVALSPAPWLAASLASLWPYRWLAPDRWRGLCGCRFGPLHASRPGAAMACLAAKVATSVAGKVAKVAGIVVRFCAKVDTKVASVCGKVATKVARFTPKS